MKGAGKQVVFDTNYRPRPRLEDATARTSFDAMRATTSGALPSYDDEEPLYPGLSFLQIVDRIAGFGPQEVVLKNGARGPMIRAHGKTVQTELAAAARVVDTFGVGDNFNAGYLAARFRGKPPLKAAAAAGHGLASVVICHHGAVITREAMPAR